MATLNDTTIVLDVGARYGVHPSWNGFDAPARYIAFEPDPEEANRLRDNVASTKYFSYEVLELALDSAEAVRDFHLLRHRGLSSFLKPDLTSECFRHLKPGQAEIDRIIPIATHRLDTVCSKMDIVPDFIKVDTEGTEHDVIEGAEKFVIEGFLGVRSSCNFQACFIGQKLFSESHIYLLAHDFFLLNLDYSGYGYPRLGLFRKPDPIEREDFRYGILVAADAVWIRKPEYIEKHLAGEKAAIANLKLAYFCMLNNAPDYGIDLLREDAAAGRHTDAVRSTRLYKTLRLRAARFLGRWRTVPDDQWEKAREIYRKIFGDELQGGSDFYPQVNRMAKEL
jgi:FkbM family methyltransferase